MSDVRDINTKQQKELWKNILNAFKRLLNTKLSIHKVMGALFCLLEEKEKKGTPTYTIPQALLNTFKKNCFKQVFCKQLLVTIRLDENLQQFPPVLTFRLVIVCEVCPSYHLHLAQCQR